MQNMLLVVLTLFFPFFACTKSVQVPKGPLPVRPFSGVWNSLSPDTEVLVLLEPERLPVEVRDLVPGTGMADSCGPRPAKTVWILQGGHARKEPFTAMVFEHEKKSGKQQCIPRGIGRFRQWPLLSRDEGNWVVWTPDATIRASRIHAQFLADRLAVPVRKGSDIATTGAPEELVRAVGSWRSGSQPDPVVSIWFAGTDRVRDFLRPLFPDPPLRGEILVFVTDAWVQVRIRLDFSSTAVAELAVIQLRDGLVQTIHSGHFPRMDWKSALEPLVVHPEGSQLFVQWSMPVVRALPLFLAGWEGVRHVDGNP